MSSFAPPFRLVGERQTMTARTTDTETRIAFAGDWHRNGEWAAQTLQRLHDQFPDVRTVAHAGDFGFMPGKHPRGFLEAVDTACEENQIDRILVTPGNHEDWSSLDAEFADNPGQPAQFSERVWALPRGYRFTIGGRTLLSFGGAASVDYAHRTPGYSWWEGELPTPADVEAAISGGPVDILVTHDTINGGTARVERMLATNPQRWPYQALAYSAVSRARVTEVWEAVQPAVLVHGHMHLADQVSFPDGRQVLSLGCDDAPRNIGVLTLETLEWTWCSEPAVPGE
jgi:hypothetical protein